MGPSAPPEEKPHRKNFEYPVWNPLNCSKKIQKVKNGPVLISKGTISVQKSKKKMEISKENQKIKLWRVDLAMQGVSFKLTKEIFKKIQFFHWSLSLKNHKKVTFWKKNFGNYVGNFQKSLCWVRKLLG